jgi:hypothetical protein
LSVGRLFRTSVKAGAGAIASDLGSVGIGNRRNRLLPFL